MSFVPVIHSLVVQGRDLFGDDADQKGQDGPVITADYAKAILAGLDGRMGASRGHWL